MKKIIITLCIMLSVFCSFITSAKASTNTEIGVPAIRDSINISVSGANGLWEPGDPLGSLQIAVDPYGGSVVEYFYDEDVFVVVVYFNPALVYFEPTGAYVNGHAGTVWLLQPNTYEVRVSKPTVVPSGNTALYEPLRRFIQTFWQLFNYFCQAFNLKK